MSMDVLLHHFDLLLDAPDSVPKLRALILQLAVRGKLVPQDPSDEPASRLLERIEEEKQRLCAEGKIHKPIKPKPVTADEVVFDMPRGWTWIRLEAIGEWYGGGTPSKRKSEYWDGDILWISPKDMGSDVVRDSELKITAAGVKGSSAKFVPPGSLLMVTRSGILRRTFPVALNEVACTVNQDLKVMVPYLVVMNRYLQLMLKGFEPDILRDLVKQGTTVQSLKYREFVHHPFPLPPLKEQQRIVARVDALMQLCDVLEAQLQKAEGMRQNVLQAVLRQAFAQNREIAAVSESSAQG